MPKTVFILSISSDIGTYIAMRLLEDGYAVVGTYRNKPQSLNENSRLQLIECDLDKSEDIESLVTQLSEQAFQWDIFISAVGELAPIGPFFECSFEEWNRSLQVNSSLQLRVLHALYPTRRIGQQCHVVLFAGGGSNGAFPRYSAYCAGKILLTKMCELIADENPDLNVFISGTGWTRTKIHQSTLDAKEDAGDNFDTTKDFLDNPHAGTSLETIYKHIIWGISAGSSVTSGRNFSIVHDGWNSAGVAFSDSLQRDPNLFKLRRHGNAEPVLAAQSPSKSR